MSGLGTPLMSMSSSADPFHFVKDDLSRRLDETRVKYDAWQYNLQNTNTAKNSTFARDTDELKSLITDLLEDTEQLGGTVQAVERDRSKFSHISESELASRRQFISSTIGALEGWRTEMGSSRTRGKINSDQRELLSRRKDGSGAGGDSNRFTRANDDFIGDQQQRQAMMKQETNQHLDAIGHHVNNLGVMAQTINVELDEQDRMIGDLDKDVDEAQASMNVAMKQMSKLLKTKDPCTIWIVIILMVVLVILFILVIS